MTDLLPAHALKTVDIKNGREHIEHPLKPSNLTHRPRTPLDTSIKPLTPREQVLRAPTPSNSPPIITDEQPRLSHVRILPTSLPWVHDSLMQRKQEVFAEGDDGGADKTDSLSPDQDDEERQERSREEQEATARALKPHSRSILDIQNMESFRLERPEGFAPPAPPKRTKKWQFGIRSRNQPHEAMLCLYKALQAQHAQWEIQPSSNDESAGKHAS